jgi:hypothetical protein
VLKLVLGLLAQTTAMGSVPLFELPREFWGEYNENLADCGTGNNDSRLRVSWNTVHFYESTGEIEKLLRQPDGSIVVVAQHSGEGQTWQSVYQMRLSEDAQILTVIHPQTAEMEQLNTDRRRCPLAKAKRN